MPPFSALESHIHLQVNELTLSNFLTFSQKTSICNSLVFLKGSQTSSKRVTQSAFSISYNEAASKTQRILLCFYTSFKTIASCSQPANSLNTNPCCSVSRCYPHRKELSFRTLELFENSRASHKVTTVGKHSALLYLSPTQPPLRTRYHLKNTCILIIVFFLHKATSYKT